MKKKPKPSKPVLEEGYNLKDFRIGLQVQKDSGVHPADASDKVLITLLDLGTNKLWPKQ